MRRDGTDETGMINSHIHPFNFFLNFNFFLITIKFFNYIKINIFYK